jgi:hypothetical protein
MSPRRKVKRRSSPLGQGRYVRDAGDPGGPGDQDPLDGAGLHLRDGVRGRQLQAAVYKSVSLALVSSQHPRQSSRGGSTNEPWRHGVEDGGCMAGATEVDQAAAGGDVLVMAEKIANLP